MNKPISTLFMITSVDGKISTGDKDAFDIDKDFPRIHGIKEGLHQYYEIEQTTDLFSLSSGKVQAKIGANQEQKNLIKSPISFLIIDNRPHLDEKGVDNFIKKSKKLFIITTNKDHPAFLRKHEDNLEIIFYENEIDFENLFLKFKQEHRINHLTVQTGGTLNSILLRKNLIDKISIVIAPALIGGKDTPSLIDGTSLFLASDFSNIKALELIEATKLNNSYIHLKYDIIHNTIID